MLQRSAVVLLVLSSLCGCDATLATQEYQKGIEFVNKNDADSAIASFRKAIEHKDDYGDAHFRLGLSYFEKKQYGTAIQSFSSAIRADSDVPHYNLGRALAYLCTNKYDLAIVDLDNTISAKPDTELLEKATAMRALAYKLKGAAIPISPPIAAKSFTTHGLLGRSEFHASHPVGSVIVYVLGHLFGLAVFVGIYGASVNGAPFNDEEKAVIIFMSLLFGAGVFFVNWGYAHWGWWITATILSLMQGTGIANKKP